MEEWRAKLAQGDTGSAWAQFLDRYRRLMFATTRRVLRDEDLAFEAFERLQDRLLADNLAILRRYQDGPEHKASFSTWLVTIVRRIVVDWVRQRSGRPRAKHPDGLSILQAQIYDLVFVEHRAHAEAFGMLAAKATPAEPLTYSRYLRDLALTYRAVGQAGGQRVALRLARGPLTFVEVPPDQLDRLAEQGRRARLGEVLATLPSEDRLALHLYVEEEMPAADVARILGWPNPKAVYNRVYRSLRLLRTALAERGLDREDL